MFGLSLLCVVASLLTSQWAILHTISASDAADAQTYDAAHQSRFTNATTWLNVGAGETFLIGVLFLILFAFHNLKGA